MDEIKQMKKRQKETWYKWNYWSKKRRKNRNLGRLSGMEQLDKDRKRNHLVISRVILDTEHDKLFTIAVEGFIAKNYRLM